MRIGYSDYLESTHHRLRRTTTSEVCSVSREGKAEDDELKVMNNIFTHLEYNQQADSF